MLGDQAQLPPTVRSSAAKDEWMERSLFERLLDEGLHCIVLDTQYRMPPSLCNFPSQKFYGGQIQSHRKDSPSPPGFPWPTADPLAIIDVECRAETVPGRKSLRNKLEAYVVADVVQGLVFHKVACSDIAVITTYGEQRLQIEAMLSSRGLVEVDLFTIDSAQGQEREYVVLSTVRAAHLTGLGHLDDLRRVNGPHSGTNCADPRE